MSQLVLRLAAVVATISLAGCTAGTHATDPDGGSSSGNAGRGGAGPMGGGGSFSIGGAGGRPSCNGMAGCNLPIPEGCGDGINNQGGTEACDDGNTTAGDGCNGACKVEPNWACPPAGACMRTFRCGDRVVNPGEVCDDGNTTAGDGCDATCTFQDPAYVCTPGMACVRSSICGNRRVEPGENCDDGNTTASDGCSASCQLESGWVCTAPGSPCARAARCGDGTVNVPLGEVCDDGNIAEGDGCSADCKVKGAGCSCVPGMRCTCPEVRCGNGTIEGTEKCDDGNAAPNDGCSLTCQVERGYVCPLVRAPCVPDCGDGILTGTEQCDPGIAVANMRMACSDLCRWNPGWACTGSPPTECHATRCGDNKKEGAEGCDVGDTNPFDGCSATCQNEPTCTAANGVCAGKCGDGILLSGEVCDDGNNLAGDGCSATCTVESGFTCRQPPLGESIDVPVVYRDFSAGHADFEPGVTGSTAATTGLVMAQLDAQGKPVLAGGGGGGVGITSAASFGEWYRNSASNHATATTMRLYYNATVGAFVNRWGPNGEPWMSYSGQAWCSGVSCAACGAPPAGRVCVQPCPTWGNNDACFAVETPMDGTPAFFPVDADTFTPAGERAPATMPPPYVTNWAAEMPAATHNFHFTSEVRYWFSFDSTKMYALRFLGDDDVWVFVNRRLAVDLGGIHTPVMGMVTISAANAFGMTNGNVYEIVVFQAERQKTSSSYQLTLSGFNAAATTCGPTCGDSVVTAPEQCDNGAMNTGGYNRCTPDCKLGPYCGDMMVTDTETCDNGRNDDAYGAASGCGPGCQLPARCGDLLVQAEYGEQCDDGTNSGAYGGCTALCQRAGYCGDGKVQTPQEQCDDGANDGTYGNCGNPMMPLPNCQFGPRCGDGIVQDAYGEQCEPMATNDPNCTVACRLPGVCGDGVKSATEECDYGAVDNNGEYGGCAPGCVLAPHCGDGIKNGPEACDDGILDNSYGGCSPQCKLAPHCGDGMVAPGYEQCDNGTNNGPTAPCLATCKINVL